MASRKKYMLAKYDVGSFCNSEQAENTTNIACSLANAWFYLIVKHNPKPLYWNYGLISWYYKIKNSA